MLGRFVNEDAGGNICVDIPASLKGWQFSLMLGSKPAVPEYYGRETHWPAESLARRQELLPAILAYQATLKE